MSALHVIRPGLLTTVQDLGRWGRQSLGVPVAGPMDPFSHRLANALVGNDRDAATLEITLTGPEVTFDEEQVVAVAGAAFELSLDARAAPANFAFVARAGSRLTFGRRLRGSRAYLAVAGGVAVPPALGSRATHLVSKMGGFFGRALAAGDRVPLGDGAAIQRDRAASFRLEPDPSSDAARASEVARAIPDRHARVRVLPGPQRERLDDDALGKLQSAAYTIANDSDRMGFRLRGPLIGHAGGTEMISDATPLGALQVPASGQPVLLMADRQTTGGYPTVATVITADIGLAGQLGPGDTISFAVCSRREAVAALIARERRLMAVEATARL